MQIKSKWREYVGNCGGGGQGENGGTNSEREGAAEPWPLREIPAHSWLLLSVASAALHPCPGLQPHRPQSEN